MSRYLTDSGTAIKWGALSGAVSAILLRSQILGFIHMIQSFGGGVNDALRGVGEWVSGRDGFVFQIVEIGIDTADAAWVANAQFVSGFGVAAVVVAAVELTVTLWLALELIEAGAAAFMGREK